MSASGGSLALRERARTRFQPAPVYPSEGRREGLRGEVFVEFLVDEAGRVADPRVVHSSNRMFEEPTLQAVLRWRFEPGRRAGRIVRFKMAVPVIFSLNE
ncbi:MAG: energy transducer TonB [Verrucomicrobia bacterium]|nr:energy transducer TonB [Verrucomicrobiota bacterium]